jgi:hypothetical protein
MAVKRSAETELREENERLRVERDNAIEMLRRCVHKDRIEAALAFEGEARSLILNDGRTYESNPDWCDDAVILMESVFKALRGEE